MAIDLGITFEEGEKQSKSKPIPANEIVEFQIVKHTMVNNSSGRPAINWQLKIINSDKYNNRVLFYRCNLPWQNPSTGTWDSSGIFMLVNLLKGVGEKWEGSSMADPEAYWGKTGRGKTKVRKLPPKDPNDPTEQPNYQNELTVLVK